MWALCERTQCSQQYFSQTLCRPHPELNGAIGGITEAFLRGGPAAAGLRPGSLALWWVPSGRAWAAGLGLGGWLNSWCHGFTWLLSQRHLGATRSSCRAGALRQEVNCLGWLLCGCEALYFRTEQASGGDRGVEEGDLIRILRLRQVQPQMAFEYH